MPSLEKELDTYRRDLPNLLTDAGKYALVHGDKVVSVWSDYGDGIQAGYTQFGLAPFQVKRIDAVEQVHFCTRSVGPVCQR